MNHSLAATCERISLSIYRDIGTLLIQKKFPGQLVVQLTDRCNAFCPHCGMRVTNPYKRSKLQADEVKRVLDAAAAKGFKAVSFTGGEPLLNLDELTMLMNYAGKTGIDYIRTGTNGFIFMKHQRKDFLSSIERVAEKLSATPMRNFWISVDSALPSVHEALRGFPGVIAGMEKALPIFHKYGIYPSANVFINRKIGGSETERLIFKEKGETGFETFHREYKKALRNLFQFVTDLGFTIATICYPMSVEGGCEATGLKAVYGATSSESFVNFSRQEKAALFKSLGEVLPEYRSRIRIFSPRTSLGALHMQHLNGDKSCAYPCRGGLDFFFIDARDGFTYPCGYRGNENLGKFWGMAEEISCSASEPCNRCDWECFRDPSELFGPLVQSVSSPVSLIKKFYEDKSYFKTWVEDLLYYRACSFFDGRKPPDYQRLSRFKAAA